MATLSVFTFCHSLLGSLLIVSRYIGFWLMLTVEYTHQLMPRGRGRKSGSSQKRITRRTISSTPRTRLPNSGDPVVGPRRSARIAGIPFHTNTNLDPEADTMLDVSRRSYFAPLGGSRSYDAGISHQRSRERARRTRLPERRSPQASSSSQRRTPTRRTEVTTTSSTGYALEFVVHPQTDVQVGLPINPAVTLQVRAVQQYLQSPPPNDDLEQYFAVATLIRSAGQQTDTTVMPYGTLTGPQLADSVHTPDSDETDVSIMGTISFPDLSIRTPGTYQIRITLMRIGAAGSLDQSAITLHTVDSHPITVAGPFQARY